MSYILTRSAGTGLQLYVDENIYGEGHWAWSTSKSLFDQPVQYKYKEWAEWRKKREQSKDPNWDYKIEHYE